MLAQVESYLSRALAVNVVRRHSRGGADSSDGFHYGPAVRIVTGNYVTGKRRGVVDGVDFGATGSGEDARNNFSACCDTLQPQFQYIYESMCYVFIWRKSKRSSVK